MSIIAVASSIVELVEKIKDATDQWDKQKTPKEQLANFFGDDAKNYLRILGEISVLAPTRLYPILDEVKEIPSKSQIDSIVAISTDVQTKFASLLSYFVKLVRDCSLISKNEGFMKNLLETNSLLYDFVTRMNAAYGNNDIIKIDEDYYSFFKLYENQLMKKEKKKIIIDEVEKAKIRMQLVKKKIVPNLSSNMISRENKKRFRESFEKLAKAIKAISVKKSVDIEMHDYVLPELKPIIILLEEIMQDMEKQQSELNKYNRLHPVKK